MHAFITLIVGIHAIMQAGTPPVQFSQIVRLHNPSTLLLQVHCEEQQQL